MTVALLGVVAAVAVGSAAVAAIGWRNVHRRLEQLSAIVGPPESANAARARAEGAAGGAPGDTSTAEVERVRLEAVVAASLDAVVVVDADGDVMARNAEAERYREARHADALAEIALTELLASARLGDRGERELELFGPPPSVLRIRAVPLRHGEVVVGAAAFIRDVSEARRTESIRRDFVANVSHELKTPIGALALLAETMASGGDLAVTQPLAARMLREADRLTRIIDDLLDLSLIETQESLERTPVGAAALVTEAVDRVRAQADAADTPLLVTDATPDLAVVCDRGQVVGAITNLLDNAVKYSDPGHTIECTVGRDDDRAIIAVRDHGIGIPARDLERIFERFYRVDRARSRATGGTGLGLSIVRHVADVHGGDVTVWSSEGEGSMFTLTLPLDASSPAEEAS